MRCSLVAAAAGVLGGAWGCGLGEMQRDISQMSDELGAVREEVAHLRETNRLLAETNERIANLERGLPHVRAVRALAEEVREDVAYLRAMSDRVAADVAHLRAVADGAAEDVATMRERTAALNRIDEATARLAEANELMSRAMIWLEASNQNMDTIITQAEVLRPMAQTLEQLRRDLREMQRTIESIPLVGPER